MVSALFERKIVMNNGVYTLSIPKDLANYLSLKEDSIMAIQPEVGKHGKYFSVWIKEKKENGEN